MKKVIALLMALTFVFAFASCGKEDDIDAKSEGVMTYDEYAAAALDSEVTIEAYVQAKQSWWDGKVTIYAQDKTGGYFIYELPITEEENNKLVPGTKIKVKGFKAEWAGEVEIIDATYEIMEGTYIAEPIDATALLGTDELVKKQNMFASFKGMTVESVTFKNDAPGDDIYVSLTKDGNKYDFCVEAYLTDANSKVYTDVSALTPGTVVDIDGFIYWYEGVNTHITAVTVAQ